MRVAAAGLADVGVRDAGERVRGGVQEHRLPGAAEVLLGGAVCVEDAAGGGGAGGEVVALALESGEGEEGGAGGRPAGRRAARQRRHLRPRARGCGGGEVPELAVEPRDLVAQRLARGRLVDLRDGDEAPVRERDHVSHLSVRSD